MIEAFMIFHHFKYMYKYWDDADAKIAETRLVKL